jgi:hypothetical protein
MAADTTVSGLNGLDGLVVTNFSLLKTAYSNGTNALGEIAIYNPSVLTIEVGDLASDNYVNGELIANTTIPDLSIMPGNNTYPIYFSSNQTLVATLVESDYRCGDLPVEIVTTKASYNGVEIPYLTQSMRAKNLSTTVNIAQALRDAGFGAILGSNCTSTS